MAKLEKYSQEMEKIKDFIKEGKIDEAVKKISLFLNSATEKNYNEYLENVIETVSTIHNGKLVIRFLIEHKTIDIPALLQNISKEDSVLRYSFLFLLKNICENEGDLILQYKEELLNKDPNIREAYLQLLLFVAGGEKKINDESLIKMIASNLKDEKEFVAEKASQVLKVIGKSSPSIINKVLSELGKECAEINTLKNRVDDILKSIVSIEKIVEEPQLEKKKETVIKKEPGEKEIIIPKEIELKKKDLELKQKILEIEEKEKKIEEETLIEREKTLKMKQELLEKEKELSKVELELKKKEIDEKQKEILKKESKLKEKK